MQVAEKEKNQYYVVWKLIATHSLFPQSLSAFGLISRMHREILKECSASSCFWQKLRDNAVRFAESEFNEQELINFETLKKSPIVLPGVIGRNPCQPDDVSTTYESSTAAVRSQRMYRNDRATERDENTGPEKNDVGCLGSGGKRTNHEELTRSTKKDGMSDAYRMHLCPRAEESGTRRFLRLCYFPVLWMHEYKRVIVFTKVPQKFQESESELQHRMAEMIEKVGRMVVHSCFFYNTMSRLMWSVEAGRRRKSTCRRYWTPEPAQKQPVKKLPKFRFHSVIAVCQCEKDADILMARRAKFRKAAHVSLSRCATSDELNRAIRAGNERCADDGSHTDPL